MIRGIRVLLVMGIALSWSAQSAALTMDDSDFFDTPTYVDFESEFPEGGFASQSIGDAVFSSTAGTDTLAILDLGSGSSLMEITGSMRVDFLNEAVRVGFDYLAGSPIYFEAYDAGGTLLNPGDTGGVTGMGFLGFESTSVPIAWVIIHDTGLTFRIDNLGFDSATLGSLVPAPEPGAALLFSVGLLTSVAAVRHKRAPR